MINSSREPCCHSPWLQSFLIFLLFAIMVSCPSSVSSSKTRISYTDHCGSLIPESTPDAYEHFNSTFLPYQNAYYKGGGTILNQYSSSDLSTFYKSFWLTTQNIYKTNSTGVFKVKAYAIFPNRSPYLVGGNSSNSHSFSSRSRNGTSRISSLRFRLEGFWSKSSGMLCMVGSAWTYPTSGKLLDLSAVLKLKYVMNSTMFTSMVSGTLTSLNSDKESEYFEPISILMFPQSNYNYSLVSEDFDKEGVDGVPESPSLGLESLDPRRRFCSSMRVTDFRLKYANNCNSTKKCNPFGGNVDFLPLAMSFTTIQCSDEDQSLRLLVEFSKNNYVRYDRPFNPSTTLVGEGSWDSKNNRLRILACRILNATDSLANARVGDCSIRLSFRFPAIWSLRSSSRIMGQIWTNMTADEPGYFEGIMFQTIESSYQPYRRTRYEYTEIERVRKSCPKKKLPKNRRGRYPGGNSYDMRFDMSVKYSGEKIAWGYFAPLFVGDHLYDKYWFSVVETLPVSVSSAPSAAVEESSSNNFGAATVADASDSNSMNISYRIGFTLLPEANLSSRFSIFDSSRNRIEISAEGIYDAETGGLCMIGCRNLGLNTQFSANESMDCEIHVNMQFPPFSAKRRPLIMGKIGSTRQKSDPLYFESLDLSSAAYYGVESKRSVKRMDYEIILVLISETLVCVFVGLQLFHAKKYPDVLPSISVVMLVILTLGHMIPLVLNFEAMFLRTHNRENFLLRTGGWLEANEVIVRVVTMVAFLMQFRLLQLSWSARFVAVNQKELWDAEKHASFASLPVYAAGGLIALVAHMHKPRHYHDSTSLLKDLRSYAGLVLDGYLLPQIFLNIFGNSSGNALSHLFYIGTTFVRLLPHAYDLYRSRNFAPHPYGTVFYANPAADLYSTAWDVIIPCGCVLFAAIIYLQQRFGGRCILPQRFRELVLYEKVPVASNEQ